MKKQKASTENTTSKTVIPLRAVEVGEVEHDIPLPQRGPSVEWLAKVKELQTRESRVIKGRLRLSIAAICKRRGLSVATRNEGDGVRVWMK